MMSSQPQFPLYIVSKGRYEYMLTSKALTRMGVRHNIVVEPDEVSLYQNAVNRMGLKATIVELDMAYKRKYELCDGLGLTKSTGSGPARNFAWDHSIEHGHKYHWVLDDNITGFRRRHNNQRIRVKSPACWKAMEDFVLQYKNVAMAGPQYYMFGVNGGKVAPLIINTRIFSCNLIKNDIPFRWRGRYNEDVILSIDILKAGWCTILFMMFQQEKMQTQKLKGGNTTELYRNGTLEKSKMLCRVHPDVARMTIRYGRHHHIANLNQFKKNKLILDPLFKAQKIKFKLAKKSAVTELCK